MVTVHSIDLRKVSDPCFAKTVKNACRVLSVPQEGCGTVKCPFYKPKGCSDWIRIEDRTGINLIPPEDL